MLITLQTSEPYVQDIGRFTQNTHRNFSPLYFEKNILEKFNLVGIGPCVYGFVQFSYQNEDGDTLYVDMLAMELVEGSNLYEISVRSNGMPLLKALHILLQICTLLKKMHSFTFAHMDLKGHNIMVKDFDTDKVW